jgi:ABC-2 type transport system permease protein
MRSLRLAFAYLRHNLMSAMAYRGAFFLQAFGMALNDAMLLFFWWMLFGKLPLLRGWDLAQVVTLYGVAGVGFGAATIVCGNAFRVAQVITSGDLDYYLVLPADPLTHLLVSRMSLSAPGEIYPSGSRRSYWPLRADGGVCRSSCFWARPGVSSSSRSA